MPYRPLVFGIYEGARERDIVALEGEDYCYSCAIVYARMRCGVSIYNGRSMLIARPEKCNQIDACCVSDRRK